MTLEELLDDLAADREKYNIGLTDSARYSFRTIVEAGDATWLHALPDDVRNEVMDFVRTFRRAGQLSFISNLGQEDLSETMRRFIELCEL